MERKVTKIVINGQEYHSLEEVPEEYRALIQGKIDEALHNPQPEETRTTLSTPIHPSSSTWVLWVLAIVGFLIYYVYHAAIKR